MFDDPDEILSKTRAVDSEPTCVEMLAGPSLELRYALQELVFFSGPFQIFESEVLIGFYSEAI